MDIVQLLSILTYQETHFDIWLRDYTQRMQFTEVQESHFTIWLRDNRLV